MDMHYLVKRGDRYDNLCGAPFDGYVTKERELVGCKNCLNEMNKIEERKCAVVLMEKL